MDTLPAPGDAREEHLEEIHIPVPLWLNEADFAVPLENPRRQTDAPSDKDIAILSSPSEKRKEFVRRMLVIESSADMLQSEDGTPLSEIFINDYLMGSKVPPNFVKKHPNIREGDTIEMRFQNNEHIHLLTGQIMDARLFNGNVVLMGAKIVVIPSSLWTNEKIEQFHGFFLMELPIKVGGGRNLRFSTQKNDNVRDLNSSIFKNQKEADDWKNCLLHLHECDLRKIKLITPSETLKEAGMFYTLQLKFKRLIQIITGKSTPA